VRGAGRVGRGRPPGPESVVGSEGRGWIGKTALLEYLQHRLGARHRDRSQALITDGHAAESLHCEAIDRLGRTLLRPELAGAYLVYGDWLRRQQRRVDAREQRVALLARGGLSNVEIGARLFLSHNTVAYHLRKVFSKLGIDSRRELASALPSSESEPVPALRRRRPLSTF
jgi:DNA-binding CsgD family transcriptional regulator